MAWFYLIIAAAFEVGWPLGFKLADLHPDKFGLFIGMAVVSMALSGLFLYIAQRTIPISTAYIANNEGFRIDYFLVSEELLPQVITSVMHDDIKGSDHCPISLEINS